MCILIKFFQNITGGAKEDDGNNVY